MKKKQVAQAAYLNLHTLIGLAAVGIVLTAFVVYAAGRTGTSKPPRQRLSSGPAPEGSVTEAWVRRINGPASGSDHGHDVGTDATGKFMSLDGLKPRQAMKIATR